MAAKTLPSILNGFEVLHDFGRDENKNRYALVLCKECGQQFKTSVYHIHKIKSCGCVADKKAQELPEYENGFKILKETSRKSGVRKVLAICKVCDREYEVDFYKLKYRENCGCYRCGTKVSSYAKSHVKILNTYKHMKARCYRKTNQDYYNYGGRGIIICNEWLNDPDVFCEWAINNGWKENSSIDRIDFNKGYFPENCRWASTLEQGRNTRRVKLTMEKAKSIREERNKLSILELADKYTVSDATIYAVLNNEIWKE